MALIISLHANNIERVEKIKSAKRKVLSIKSKVSTSLKGDWHITENRTYEVRIYVDTKAPNLDYGDLPFTTCKYDGNWVYPKDGVKEEYKDGFSLKECYLGKGLFAKVFENNNGVWKLPYRKSSPFFPVTTTDFWGSMGRYLCTSITNGTETYYVVIMYQTYSWGYYIIPEEMAPLCDSINGLRKDINTQINKTKDTIREGAAKTEASIKRADALNKSEKDFDGAIIEAEKNTVDSKAEANRQATCAKNSETEVEKLNEQIKTAEKQNQAEIEARNKALQNIDKLNSQIAELKILLNAKEVEKTGYLAKQADSNNKAQKSEENVQFLTAKRNTDKNSRQKALMEAWKEAAEGRESVETAINRLAKLVPKCKDTTDALKTLPTAFQAGVTYSAKSTTDIIAKVQSGQS